MKKLFVMVLSLCLALGCTSALAAGKLEVSQETYTVQESSSYYYCYIFAEATNTGDKNIEFDNGLLEILDGDGEPMDNDTIYSMYPSILAPGETGYIYTYQLVSKDDAPTADKVADHTLNVSGKSTKDDAATRLTAEGAYGTYTTSYGSERKAVCLTVTNSGDATVYDFNGVFGLYDAAGKLLFVNSNVAYNMGLPAGQSVQMIFSIDSDLVDLWTTNGTEPASVSVIAFVD